MKMSIWEYMIVGLATASIWYGLVVIADIGSVIK